MTHATATRRRLLDAALHEFARKGYAAATVEAVLKRARATTGSLYHHFGGKEQLAAALYVETLADYQQSALAVLARARTAERGIRGFVEHYIGWVERKPDLARYLIETRRSELSTSVRAELRALNDRFYSTIRAWVRPHVEAGTLRELAPELFSAVLLGPTHEYARHLLAQRATAPARAAARVLAEAAWQGLRTGH